MTLHQLKIFAVVASRLSIGAASAELHISQPSISQQLRLLGREVGAALHRRSGHGITLTPAGRLLLKEAKIIVARMERLKARIARDAGALGTTGTFLVGGSYSPSASLLPAVLVRFQRSHPHVRFQLRTDSRSIIERMILKGEVEIAVINNPPQNRRLKMESYRPEPVVAFGAPDFPLKSRRELNAADFGRVGFIIRRDTAGRGTVQDYIRDLQQNGYKPNVIMRCDTPTAVKEAVRRGSGVGILYRDVVADDIRRGEFKTIKMPGENFSGRSYIVYHKNRPLSPCAREFLKLLHAHRWKK